MDTLYKWRVQEKNKRGQMRWRILRSPMTEETARFWAANNHRIIERVDMPIALRGTSQPAPATTARFAAKTSS